MPREVQSSVNDIKHQLVQRRNSTRLCFPRRGIRGDDDFAVGKAQNIGRAALVQETFVRSRLRKLLEH